MRRSPSHCSSGLSVTSAAFDRIYEALASFAPSSFRELIRDQSRDFLIVSGAIAISYVLLVLGICIAYVHRLIGPIMALQRHVLGLQNGDYSARVGLRKTDVAFRSLAEDPDELARILENNAKGVR